MKKQLLLFILFLLISNYNFAQKNEDENEWLNSVFTEVELQEINEKEIEYWLSLYRSPLDLNKIDSFELQTIFSLTYEEVKVFEKYRSTFGKWLSTSELNRLDWSDNVLKRVKGCTYVSEGDQKSISFRQALKAPDQHYILTNLNYSYPLPKGFQTNFYQGIPFHIQQRIKYSKRNNYSFGITLQHDAGEVWDWQPRKLSFGVDFSSFHLSVENKGIFKKIIVGDYQMIGGQGLVFGGGYFLGKGGDPILNITRAISESRPYTSVTESGFFRGGSATVKLKRHLDITLLGSHNKLNASSTSFTTTGLHRTLSELERKKSLTHFATGSRMMFENKKLKLGGNILYNEYGENLEVDRRDSLSVFRGDKVLNSSIDCNYYWKNISVFSEFGYSSFGGLAGIISTYISMSKVFDMVFSYRNYAYDYIAPQGSALADGQRSTNEKGFYVGYKWKRGKKVLIQGHFDLFQVPFPSYRNDGGTEGTVVYTQVNYKVNDIINSLYFSFKWRQSGKYLIKEDERKASYIQESTTRCLLGINILDEDAYQLKSSAQIKYHKGLEESYGFLLTQDFSFQISKRLKFDGRLAVFHTDDFNARLYSYEKNVQYSFSFPPYYGKGWRSFMMLKYKMNRGISITGRWSKTTFEDRDLISSGWNEVKGNSKSDLTMQLKISI